MILTINAGSSSLKTALFANGAAIARADLEGHDSAILTWADAHRGAHPIAAAGHRIVHGGRDFTGPVLITEETIAAMQALTPLAPLHQPHCLAAIRTLRQAAPNLPQVACFDTAFHRTMPAIARRFAIPRALHADGIEHYGFHGLNYAHIAARLAELDPALAAGRVVAAHLGNGASLCALHAGRSIDTTMGATALDGLPMGTRCGAIDPGVLLYLLQERSFTPAALEDLLYHRSGLLGVSDESADMRILENSTRPAAHEAIDLFAYQVARQACQMASALGGIDGMVFTGGIGEHSAAARANIIARLAWLGLKIDNDEPGQAIPSPAPLGGCAAAGWGEGQRTAGARRIGPKIWVIPADEEAVIARQTASLVQPA